MRKLVSIFLIIILSFINISFSASEELENFDGIDIYRTIYENIKFDDIDNHWAKKYINKMSALSIIKGMGNNKFSPDDTLTIEQTIILLSRLLGLEAEAQRIGEESIKLDTGNYKILNPYDYWVRGYIEVAKNNNILSTEEYNELTNFSDELISEIKFNVNKKLLVYENDYNLTQNQLDNIEKDLTEKEERKYSFGQPITRERLAVWVSRILNLEPISGRDQHLVFKFSDWKEIDTENIPIIEAIVKERIMIGNTENEFNPKGYLKRSEMTTVLDIISDKVLVRLGFTINKGVVRKIYDTNEIFKDNITNKNININKKTFLVNSNNNEFKITSKSSIEKVNENGFIVLKNNEVYLPDEIKELDYIKYYINDKGKVVLVEVLNDNILEIEGLVEEIDIKNSKLTLRDFNDNLYSFNVLNSTSITVNNIPLNLEELLIGQTVKVKLNNSDLVSITGYLDEGEEGFINPNDKVVTGTVLYRTTNSITIQKNNEELEFKIDENTDILKNNLSVSPLSIKEGDNVRLEFTEYKSVYPKTIYVSNISKPITNIYKGKISYYNIASKDLYLSDLKYYSNGEWIRANTNKVLLSYDIDVYKNNKKISLNELNKNLDKEIILVCENYFGKEKGIKAIVKTNYETVINDKLQNISFGLNTLTVDYNEVEFDYDSTIVIKDNRLVHPYNLNESDTLYVLLEGLDNKKANLIVIEEAPKTDVIVYSGEIIDILKYGFKIKDYKMYYNNSSYSTELEKEFKITNETIIYDTRNNKSITVDEFNNQRFIDNKYYDSTNYYNEQAIIVENNAIVTAFNIVNKNTDFDILSSSEIESIDLINNKITLKNIKDYNSLSKKWIFNNTNFDLDVSDALIIKDGKPIELYKLSKNDSVYIYRKNNVGFVLIVK